jgi:hypothetical protein
MLRLEWLINDDIYDERQSQRVFRNRVYFELCDRQYRQCFRLTKNQIAFILSKIEHILTHTSKRNKAITAAHLTNVELLTTLTGTEMVHNMVWELHMEYQLYLSVDVFKGLIVQFLPTCFQILLSGLKSH